MAKWLWPDTAFRESGSLSRRLPMNTVTETNVRLIASPGAWIEGEAVRQLYATANLEGMQVGVGFPDLHPGKARRPVRPLSLKGGFTLTLSEATLAAEWLSGNGFAAPKSQTRPMGRAAL